MRAPGRWRRPRAEPSSRWLGRWSEADAAAGEAPAAARTPLRTTASRITGAVMAAVLRHPGAVVVQDDTGAVWAVARLSAAQAEDPQLVVLLDHPTARGYLADAGGEAPAAARRATSDLRARGDLV